MKKHILYILFALFSCNSEKKYYNEFYEKLGGNYEIIELNYISSQGVDSTIYDAGTFYFESCKYNKSSSESLCDGEIWLEQLDLNGTFRYEVFAERTMWLSTRWIDLENDERDPLGATAHNCEVFFEGEKTILEFKDRESAQNSNFNKYPYSIILEKY